MSLSGPYVRKTGREGSGDSQYTRTYTLPLEVISNDYNDDAVAVRGYVATFYPLGSPYGNDPGAVVQGYRESQQDDWQLWHVDVLYSSKIDIRAAFGSSGGQGGSGGGGAQNADPLLRAPEFTFSVESYQQAVTKDFTSPTPKKLVNSLGDPFFPPIELEYKRLVMQMKLTKSTYDPFVYSDLLVQPTTNHALFLNFFPPLTVHYCDHTADSLQENGVWYWTLTHKFQIKLSKWNPVQILDQGFRFFAPLAGPIPFVDNAGQRATMPGFLNGAGGALEDGADPEYLEFELFFQEDYGVLEP